MPIAALLAVISALSYGVSDYYAALATRQLTLIPATAASYLVATVIAGLAMVATGPSWSAPTIWWGLAAAVAAIAGLLGFYQAAAIGPMSLVTPLISVLESAVPVAVAVALGERLHGGAWLAVALAIAGSILMSLNSETRGRLALRTALLAVASGLALGLSVVFLDRTPSDAGVTPAFVELAGGLAIVGAIMLLRRRRLRPGARPRPRTGLRTFAAPTLSGLLLGAANILLVIALQHGELAVVGVLVSLYPVSTIVLARLLGTERPGPWQWTGIGCALAASALFAA